MSNEVEKLKIAEQQTDTNPTETQKENGSYDKGRVTLSGIPIVIENPKGSVRRGIDSKGNAWSNEMLFTYGYIENTIGNDGDQIDIFIGDSIDNFSEVFIITQVDPCTRIFDEHKVMFGFNNQEEAYDGYCSCYSSDWNGFGNIICFSIDDFKIWLLNKSVAINNLSKEKMEDKLPVMKVIKLEGEVIEGKTLLDLQNQAEDPNNFDVLVVEIASPGGSVSEGIEIIIWLDKISQLQKQVITVVTANAYSIASLIMLAADKRLISKHADVMVHNPMMPELKHVNANELEDYVKRLRDLESTMYELYGIFTGLQRDQIKELMDNETYLSSNEAIQFGFADEEIDIEPRPKSMVTNNKNILNMSKTLNILNRVIGVVSGLNIVNQLYYDDMGGEIEIYQNDPSQYAVGDKTNVQNGEIVLSDGAKITIADYVITAIDKTTTPAAAADPIVAPDPIVPPSAVDPTAPKAAEVTVDPTKQEVPAALEAPAPADPLAPKAEEIKDPVAEIDPSILEKLAEMELRISVLEKKVTEIEGVYGEVDKKMTNAAKFEELATEAIDMIASNSVSGFAPSAKAKVEAAPTGSIFTQMKAKAGLK